MHSCMSCSVPTPLDSLARTIRFNSLSLSLPLYLPLSLPLATRFMALTSRVSGPCSRPAAARDSNPVGTDPARRKRRCARLPSSGPQPPRRRGSCRSPGEPARRPDGTPRVARIVGRLSARRASARAASRCGSRWRLLALERAGTERRAASAPPLRISALATPPRLRRRWVLACVAGCAASGCEMSKLMSAESWQRAAWHARDEFGCRHG